MLYLLGIECHYQPFTATMFHYRFLIVIYPAQGHINPTFQFAKRLVQLGARVTISTTLFMHRRITDKPSLPSLSFLPFSDGYDDGFPRKDISGYTLYKSELKLRGSEFVTNLIASNAEDGNPFTCLIYTPLFHWAAEVARGFHIPTAMLWTQPATVLDIFYHYFHGYGDYIAEKVKEPSCSIELPGLPLLAPRDLPSFLLGLNPNLDPLLITMFQEQIEYFDMETKPLILVNTFEELEPEAFMAVDKINMIPIGPLIPSAFLDGKDPSDTSFGGHIFPPSEGYMEWLDSKPHKTVAYVSFGSFCDLSNKQMEEIARALLDSGVPFLWVIREKEKEEEELSCREEMEEKGKIVKWCSQVEVLSHPSLGCFVTHCGWNSSIESLVCGVPMVAFPQWTDQKTNAKLIEDVWKIGMRVDEGMNEEGVVERDEIRRCLEVVLGNGEKGEELRMNARKWKSLAKEAVKEGGSSQKYLNAFLDNLPQQSKQTAET